MGGDQVIAGVGLRPGCGTDEIVELVRLAAAGRTVTALAAPSFRGNEAGLLGAASALGAELVLVDAAALAAVQARCLTRSERALASVGVAMPV